MRVALSFASAPVPFTPRAATALVCTKVTSYFQSAGNRVTPFNQYLSMNPHMETLIRLSALNPEEWQERAVENLPGTHNYCLESVGCNDNGTTVLWNRDGSPVELGAKDCLPLVALLLGDRITWGRIQALAKTLGTEMDTEHRREIKSILSLFLMLVPPNQYMVPRWNEEDALNQIPCLIWTTDRELRLASAGGGVVMEHMDQLPDHIGEPIQKLIGVVEGDEEHQAIAAHRRVLRGDPICHFEGVGVATGRPYMGHVRPIIDRDGNVQGVAGFALRLGSEEQTTNRESSRLCA